MQPSAAQAQPLAGKTPLAHGQLLLLASSHFMVDVFSGALSPLLPPLIAKFGLSVTLAALLLAAYQMIASFGQVIFGLLADRFPGFNFSVWGLVVTGTCISALGWIPWYGLALALMIVAGFSTACFHPQAAAMSGEAARGSRAFGMAIFMTAGRMGFAAGPLAAAPIAAYFGLTHLIVLAFPAWAIAACLHRYRSPTLHGAPWPGLAGFLKPFANNFRPLMLLLLFEAFRTSVMTCVSAFLPLMLIGRGYSLVAGGASVSVFIGAGALGNLLGGRIADRVGRRSMFLLSSFGAIPLAYGFLWTGGIVSWIFLCLLGATLLSTLGVTLAKGQELVPESSGTVSSLMMGVTWTLGSLGLLVIGALADWIGLSLALALLFLLLFLGGLCAWLLPPDQVIRSATPSGQL